MKNDEQYEAAVGFTSTKCSKEVELWCRRKRDREKERIGMRTVPSVYRGNSCRGKYGGGKVLQLINIVQCQVVYEIENVYNIRSYSINCLKYNNNNFIRLVYKL